MICRPVLAADRNALADRLDRTYAFTAGERTVAPELIGDALGYRTVSVVPDSCTKGDDLSTPPIHRALTPASCT